MHGSTALPPVDVVLPLLAFVEVEAEVEAPAPVLLVAAAPSLSPLSHAAGASSDTARRHVQRVITP